MLITKRHLSSYEPKPTVILENRLNNLSYLFNPKKDAITVFLSHKHNEDEILELGWKNIFRISKINFED